MGSLGMDLAESIAITQRKEVKSMQIKTSLLAAVLLLGNLAGSALAADGVLFKQEAGNFCHMKFPAIEESTLLTDHPQLKSADSGDIIDYYGSCDHDPLGKDEVISQMNDPLRGLPVGSYRTEQ